MQEVQPKISHTRRKKSTHTIKDKTSYKNHPYHGSHRIIINEHTGWHKENKSTGLVFDGTHWKYHVCYNKFNTKSALTASRRYIIGQTRRQGVGGNLSLENEACDFMRFEKV